MWSIFLGAVCTVDHEVVPCQMAFFHGHTFIVQFLKNVFLRSLGLSLGVNQTWTKKNDRIPKSRCVDFFKYMSKKGSFGVFLCLTFSPFFSPYLMSTTIMFAPKYIDVCIYIYTTFLCHGLVTFAAREPLMPLFSQNSLDRDMIM